jgi:RNA binding exosome subunit
MEDKIQVTIDVIVHATEDITKFEQRQELLQSLEERIHNSAFHLRLNKQKLILRQLELREKDPVKVKIFTPIYKKTDSTKIYSTLLKLAN